MQPPTTILPRNAGPGKAREVRSDALCAHLGFNQLDPGPTVAGDFPGLGPALLFAQDCSARFYVLQQIPWEQAATIIGVVQQQPGALVNDVDLVIVTKFLTDAGLWDVLAVNDAPTPLLWRVYQTWQATVPGMPGPRTPRAFARAMASLGYVCTNTRLGPVFSDRARVAGHATG